MVIKGRNMTFHAPVYGDVFSDGGTIRLENSFGWGRAVNPSGIIKARTRTFNATLQAPGGRVELASAESCLIIGHEVNVREAVKCQIFAHTLRIEKATGCLIAGRDIEIHHSRPYKQEPNVITMVVPEVPDLDAMLGPIQVQISDMGMRLDQLAAQIGNSKADTTLTQYLTIRAKVRAGMIKLTADQTKGFLEMADRLEDSAKVLEGFVAERTAIAKKLAAAVGQVQAIKNDQGVRLANCRCNILHVDGETIVRQLLDPHDDPDLSLIPLPMIPKILFRNDASLKFLYAVQTGKVEWNAGIDRLMKATAIP